MSWGHHHRRRAAITAVLVHAAQHPANGLGYDHLPEVREQFSSRRELVLALQHDWSQAMWARIEALSFDPKGAPADARASADQAWRECAVEHAVLRRLLDECADEIGPSRLPEQCVA